MERDEWCLVIEAGGLQVGAVVAHDPGLAAKITTDGAPVTAWRTSSGIACVVSDRCPHQWSSLSDEGFVDGERLVCAAHGWRFAADGTGSKTAMNGREDEKSPVVVYECREDDAGLWVRVRNGLE